MASSKVYSLPVGEETETSGIPHRYYKTTDALSNFPLPDVTTLYDVFQHSVRTYQNQESLGYRKVTKVISEEKLVKKNVGGEIQEELKTWNYFQLSHYNWYSYNDVNKISTSIAAGLLQIGLGPKTKLLIFAKTSVEWMLMAQACYMQGIIVVTAYDTLGEEGVLHAANEGEIPVMFTTAELLKTASNVAAKASSLKHVIYMETATAENIESFKAANSVVELHSFDQIKELGEQYPADHQPPKSDDLACIMYTSGTTGTPKGVMLTHSNLVAGVAGTSVMFKHILGPGDIIIAYLPLAHVLEFLVEHAIMYWGVAVGYGSIRTLTDASVRNCLGDLRELRPTILTGVPAVWETIRKGVVSKVHEAGGLTTTIFETALSVKKFLTGYGIPCQFIDDLFFKKIRDQTGGRLRIALSGGAPIAHETQEFLTLTVCPILQGYGMTEATAMCCLMTPESFSYGASGPPVPCSEIKLVDVEDAGYSHRNNPPQGEVWVRGPTIMKGYFNNEELTKEVLTEDGWLKTGDIGEWRPDGSLAIIDRRKNLVKLSNGEYIALERLEALYKTSLYVQNLCVYGDSFQSHPVALIVPVEDRLRKLAQQKGVPDVANLSMSELCANKEVKKGVLESFKDIAKRSRLVSAEVIQNIHLCEEEWTSENNMLTAAQKVKRRDVIQKYQAEVEAMYK
ncbi:long-chain-fatty-acid-CoA ligase 1 [Basidiobolus meristosporus CBS 931.73]|uniref:Long-chain-fatty-acid-CoA ligase 1 n=1 Tax=Basidiobolus meristosporus CBS 931.73 TaxID=1314790 RepID=A0A1Y1XL46_9FUNG|nr:long-chain-fatty-acid-CoA ligase 1 [Basidiobolus meristosporus CBS 931.73]|eukprot:ORX86487.1 long-chain-fatty-acid-CoA ligase 1 [Basidiobolus meristosporus CBS 931.73]